MMIAHSQSPEATTSNSKEATSICQNAEVPLKRKDKYPEPEENSDKSFNPGNSESPKQKVNLPHFFKQLSSSFRTPKSMRRDQTGSTSTPTNAANDSATPSALDMSISKNKSLFLDSSGTADKVKKIFYKNF